MMRQRGLIRVRPEIPKFTKKTLDIPVELW